VDARSFLSLSKGSEFPDWIITLVGLAAFFFQKRLEAHVPSSRPLNSERKEAAWPGKPRLGLRALSA